MAVKNGIFPEPETYLRLLEKSGTSGHLIAYRKVLECARIINENGGRALLVGGSVRDFLMDQQSRDYDLEVYGLEPDQVESILNRMGKINEVGKAFGILKLALDGGIIIDVSLPRTDSISDGGKTGFGRKADPNMSIREAARRRDFTMNSVAADPLTGQLYDYFDGVRDIKSGILRITDRERFKDDPVRVLRALQFIGRFGLQVEEGSVGGIQELAPNLGRMPKERIGVEW